MAIAPEITEAQINAEMQKMSKKKAREKIEQRQRSAAEKIELAKKKKAEQKLIDDKIKARKKYLEDLPRLFKEKVEIAILKNMERYEKVPQAALLERIYKLAFIKKELLEDIK